jgi:hypothetical protein
MILEAKKVLEILQEYELDLLEQHLKAVLSEKSDSATTITAVAIRTVREIRDRLGIPEIKA